VKDNSAEVKKNQDNELNDLTSELKKKFNIDAMVLEKEAEINTYVVQLDAFKLEIEESQSRAQNYTNSKATLEEEKTELSSSLKK